MAKRKRNNKALTERHTIEFTSENHTLQVFDHELENGINTGIGVIAEHLDDRDILTTGLTKHNDRVVFNCDNYDIIYNIESKVTTTDREFENAHVHYIS